MKIHIEWNGPYDLEKICELSESTDYGVYQVYGTHPIYGSDVLLYIGQAKQQYFSKRIPQHEKFFYNQDSENITFYVGRLGGNNHVSGDEWDSQIDIAEKHLIFSHKPAFNSSNIESINNDIIPENAHVFNWQDHKNLLPEVSAFRYFADDDIHFKKYNVFDEDNI